MPYGREGEQQKGTQRADLCALRPGSVTELWLLPNCAEISAGYEQVARSIHCPPGRGKRPLISFTKSTATHCPNGFTLPRKVAGIELIGYQHQNPYPKRVGVTDTRTGPRTLWDGIRDRMVSGTPLATTSRHSPLRPRPKPPRPIGSLPNGRRVDLSRQRQQLSRKRSQPSRATLPRRTRQPLASPRQRIRVPAPVSPKPYPHLPRPTEFRNCCLDPLRKGRRSTVTRYRNGGRRRDHANACARLGRKIGLHGADFATPAPISHRPNGLRERKDIFSLPTTCSARRKPLFIGLSTLGPSGNACTARVYCTCERLLRCICAPQGKRTGAVSLRSTPPRAPPRQKSDFLPQARQHIVGWAS